jgi:DNA-binding CsgD family transcriptional regulator
MSRPVLLTEAQADVLGALALCRTPQRIARRLGMSHGAVSSQITNLRYRLGVERTDQIVPRARELGLIR